MPVREMLPERGKRVQRPRWEVTNDAGQVLGWVRQVHMPGCRTAFFDAVALTARGERVDLEMTNDRAERVDALRRFGERPEEFARHLRR